MPQINARHSIARGWAPTFVRTAGCLLASVALGVGAAGAHAGTVPTALRAEEATEVGRWSDGIWAAAKTGNLQGVEAALKEVPDELLEAGALDGMGPVRRFFNITLPMISPVILFNIITLMIGSLQVFAIPYVLSAATPGNDPRAMYFFTSSMYDNAFRYNQMGYASAQAWLQLLISLGLTAIMFAASKRLVHYRA